MRGSDHVILSDVEVVEFLFLEKMAILWYSNLWYSNLWHSNTLATVR